MDYRDLWDVVSGWVKHNSTLVLSGVAVGGVVSTALLAFKAGRDYEYVRAIKMENGEASDPKTVLRDTWPYFVAPVCSAGLTISAVILSHRVNMRQQAAIAGALAISEKTLNDYRDKVAEIVSHRKAEQAHEEVIDDQIKKTPPWDSEIVKTGNGENRCYDTYTGRYFLSTRQQIDNAVNMLNNQLNNHEYGSLNDFYGFVGLGPTAAGDDLGWSSDKLLEVSYSSHLADDGDPCLAVYFQVQPRPFFWKAN